MIAKRFGVAGAPGWMRTSGILWWLENATYAMFVPQCFNRTGGVMKLKIKGWSQGCPSSASQNMEATKTTEWQ